MKERMQSSGDSPLWYMHMSLYCQGSTLYRCQSKQISNTKHIIATSWIVGQYRTASSPEAEPSSYTSIIFPTPVGDWNLDVRAMKCPSRFIVLTQPLSNLQCSWLVLIIYLFLSCIWIAMVESILAVRFQHVVFIFFISVIIYFFKILIFYSFISLTAFWSSVCVYSFHLYIFFVIKDGMSLAHSGCEN